MLSDDALCVLVPILEEIIGLRALEIRTFFEGHGLLIQEWDKVRTDWLTIGPPGPPPDARGLSLSAWARPRDGGAGCS